MNPELSAFTPEMPTLGGEYVFYASDARKMRIYAKRMDYPGVRGPKPHFIVYRAVAPQPGQENMTPLAEFLTWEKAYQFGERTARWMEQRDIDADYAAAFGPHPPQKQDAK